MESIELRTPTQIDVERANCWFTDPELVAMDPPAGIVDGLLLWSIYCDNIHIGFISIYNRSGTSAELGVRIGEKQYWGRGLAQQAVERVLDFCKQLNFSTIHLKVIPSNTRAIRLYEKCGFTKTSTSILDGIAFIRMEIHI